MKNILLMSAVFLMAITIASGQADTTTQKKTAPKIEQYWFVLIKTGPKTDFDSSTRARLFKGHMENMQKLYYDGILKVAGPFGKNEFTWRGLFIFDCKTKEEAEQIAATDPAVAAGLFAVDIVPWYGEPIGSFVHGKPNKKE